MRPEDMRPEDVRALALMLPAVVEGAHMGHADFRVGGRIFATLWTWPDDPASAARRLEDAGASAIGTNCGRGLEDVLAATEALCGSVSLPLIAKPSAGLAGALIPPDRFELAASRFVRMGVRLLGGCCGTTEAHIAAMRSALW